MTTNVKKCNCGKKSKIPKIVIILLIIALPTLFWFLSQQKLKEVPDKAVKEVRFSKYNDKYQVGKDIWKVQKDKNREFGPSAKKCIPNDEECKTYFPFGKKVPKGTIVLKNHPLSNLKMAVSCPGKDTYKKYEKIYNEMDPANPKTCMEICDDKVNCIGVQSYQENTSRVCYYLNQEGEEMKLDEYFYTWPSDASEEIKDTGKFYLKK